VNGQRTSAFVILASGFFTNVLLGTETRGRLGFVDVKSSRSPFPPSLPFEGTTEEKRARFVPRLVIEVDWVTCFQIKASSAGVGVAC
jgi:hypothetical protein